LNLTVNQILTRTIDKTICKLDSYDFYGTLLDTEGVYFETIPGIDCDTAVTLNLSVVFCSEIEVRQIDEICAEELFLTLNYNILRGDLVCYNIIFESKATDAGFDDVYCENPVSDGIIEIPVPQFENPYFVRPDNYKMNVDFEFLDGAILTFEMDFTVLYPSWIIQQKWDNVLALLNYNYNGGYSFSAYEWYKGSAIIPSENMSYLYIEKNNVLDYEAQYRAKLTRADDGVTLFTCPMTPEPPTYISTYPTLVNAGYTIQIPAKANGTTTFISVSGILVGKEQLVKGENSIKVPLVQGFYIMVIEENSRETTKQIIIVK